MCETRLRVVYRPVSSDLPNGSMHFDDEEHVDLVDFEELENQNGGTYVRGTTEDGRDVVVRLGGRKEVRARPAGDDGTFSNMLGYRQRLKGVSA